MFIRTNTTDNTTTVIIQGLEPWAMWKMLSALSYHNHGIQWEETLKFSGVNPEDTLAFLRTSWKEVCDREEEERADGGASYPWPAPTEVVLPDLQRGGQPGSLSEWMWSLGLRGGHEAYFDLLEVLPERLHEEVLQKQELGTLRFGFGWGRSRVEFTSGGTVEIRGPVDSVMDRVYMARERVNDRALEALGHPATDEEPAKPESPALPGLLQVHRDLDEALTSLGHTAQGWRMESFPCTRFGREAGEGCDECWRGARGRRCPLAV